MRGRLTNICQQSFELWTIQYCAQWRTDSKPYKDSIRLAKGDSDPIERIEFFQIQNGKNQPHCLWMVRAKANLLGSIVRGDDSSGIRVRVGNIQIGDAHLLDFCFREPRFNSYVTGEVHVEGGDLIPNSRGTILSII